MKKTIVFSVFSIILTIILAEVCVRMFSDINDYIIPVKTDSHHMFLLKGERLQKRNYDWYWDLLSSDYVRPELNIEGDILRKDSKRQKVLFIGDSGTFGLGVLKNQAFPNLIKKDLKLEFSNTDFFNLGIPGATPPDIIYAYKNYLHFFNPDVVVLTLYMANDINHSYGLNDDFINYSTKPEGQWHKKIALVKLLYVLKVVSTNDQKVDFHNFPTWNKKDQLNIMDFVDGEFLTYQKRYDEQTDIAVNNLKKILIELNRLTKSIDAKLIVATIPTRSQLRGRLSILPDKPDAISYFKDLDYYKEDELDFNKPERIVKEICRELNVLYVENKLLNRSSLKENVLIENDSHLSVEGHKVFKSQLIAPLKKLL